MRTARRIATAALILALVVAGVSGMYSTQSTEAAPTCSNTLDIAVHGEHVVGDYVTGIGHETMAWPPSSEGVGETTSANGGASIIGGPGIKAHDPAAPGASFCISQSRSPGIHF
jgi:hypothetical protein